MVMAVATEGVAASTESLKRILVNPWAYFPNLIGGDLVGLGQVGPNRFLAAFGRSWKSGTASQTDPPKFSSTVTAGPRLFDIDSASGAVTELTPSLLMTPNASLRAAVMSATGMHLIVSTDTGTHAQFVQAFASQTLRALEPKPLSPSVWSNGEKSAVEWDRGAAHERQGFLALGADSDNQLYVSLVTATLSGAHGYDPSRRSYLSDKGWTGDSSEQTPLRRVGGQVLTSTVPVGLTRRRQWWLLLIPKQIGSSWGWELLRSSSLTSPFAHVRDIPGASAGPIPGRFLPGIVLKADPMTPPGVAWCCSTESDGSFIPQLEQLLI